jgi:hypothetical protein
MSADPVAIPHTALTAALTAWGVDPADLLDLTIRVDRDGGWLQVTRARRDPDGHPLHAGGGLATVTVIVGIDPATTGEDTP